MPLAVTDAALLNAILFCGDQLGTRLNKQKERQSAVIHLKRTIQLLNERLQDSLHAVSDSTIAAVSALALTEVGFPIIFLMQIDSPS